MWLILLGGCLSYEEGQAQVGELNCELAEACDRLATWGYDDVDACVEHAVNEPYDEADCAAYDAKAMRACIDAYEAAVEASDCDYAPGDECRVCG
ncbi:MAG: hypothetical protein ACOZNI_21600 [Myxococcota bacterium]